MPNAPTEKNESEQFLTAHTDGESDSHNHAAVAATSDRVVALEHKVDFADHIDIHKPFAASATNPNFEMRSFSVKLDGQASIEHQIDIHVQDLIEVNDVNGFSLSDILEGLKYVMDYRIRGGKMKHLNAELMARLMEALLQNMGHESGSLMKKRPTVESDLAFTLFGEFLEEVEEFRRAVGTMSATDLRQSLNIHRRCQPYSTKEQREDAAAILNLLTTRFVQFEDWRELVRADEQDDAEELIKEYAPRFKDAEGAPIMPPVDEDLFPPPALYFDKNSEKLAHMFGSDIRTGLPSAKVTLHQAHYGPNTLPAPPKPSVFKMLWAQLTDFMIIILIVAAIAEFSMGDPDPAIVLLVVVVLNVVIGFSQEWRANRALEALLTLSVPKATVIRDGKQEVIDSAGLVPGDLVVLEEGEAVPADLRLCEVSQLDIIEAILTGESVGTEKSIRTIRKKTRKIPLTDCKGSAFMTTVVARGRGKGIVVRIGEHTEIGRISKAITGTKNEETPIQKKLHSLGKWLVLLAVFLCILVIVIGIAYKRPALDMVKVGMSLAVSVIPEGLVAVVTVTMALAVGRMAKRNAIVRKLPSVETLGSVTHICSDKTGTLTEGKMGASGLWTSDNSLFVFSHPKAGKDGHVDVLQRVPLATALADVNANSGSNDVNLTTDAACSKSLNQAPTHLVVASMISALCCNATIEKDPENESGFKSTGDPTEVALVVASQIAGFSKSYFEGTVGMEKLGEYAFDSDRKIMSVLYGQSEGVSGVDHFDSESAFVLVKGAPEGVLHRCKNYLPPVDDAATASSAARGDGQSVDFLAKFPAATLTEEYVNYISARSEHMAAQGLRVLALAIRKVTKVDAKRIIDSKKQSEAESNLTFVGLIGLIDPPKAGVKESIEKCKRAGIKVIMITGDHVTTAAAIAKQLGIVDATNSRCMKGPELDLISEDALADLRPFPVVFARVSPDNKLKIVRALQSRLYSVAMTGDGVNDAPAIKKADVGVAMGIGGTEITKQAADIVLADDNFSTIIEAVQEGRQVFDNIKKFIVYLLSCNGAEIFLFLASALINTDMPFTTMQILWANIIADIPPAMSLGVEPAEKNILDRPPRIPGQGVLDTTTTLVIVFQALVQSMSTLAIYLLAQKGVIPDAHTLGEQQSLAFATLTTMQLVQAFLSRSVELSVFVTGVVGNPWMIGAFLGSSFCLLIGIYIPGLAHWLELEPIYSGWEAVAVAVLIQIILVEVMKIVVREVRKREAAAYSEDSHLRRLPVAGAPKPWWKKLFSN
ncbi:UNVERIFIED_CONTAM: P-type ATPase [Siphonaria sp. JEL0065]|nr:P-type ATPase [Siphonaria sp. JEL0065]